MYKILVYPIKSLPPVEVPEARITRSGGLEWDRVYVIKDANGRIINGKRERRVHLIRARYSLREKKIYVSACCSGEEAYRLDEPGDLERWLSGFLGYKVRLEYVEEGMPDDLKRRGPTIVAHATLVEVASWYEGHGWDIMQARLRFRANLEVAGVPAFWEDTLYYGGDRGARVYIGEAAFEGRGISARCVVPSRDPFTAAVTPGFQKDFARRRKPMLKGKYPESDAGYRLVLNTITLHGSAGKTLRLFDPVRVEHTV
ncbi:MAG: MOSC N-terminal beta barrel domain-containing protein [Desulfurococcales archaeon]|nr:MOSC N-terminal beta barrel domain-containing protein [Desulfurococcales archaeon]